MMMWVRRLLTPHRPEHERTDVQPTDPEEKRQAEERAKHNERLVWLLEEQAKALTLGRDNGDER
jgi:uncharacterized membrane protein YccC